MAHQSWGKDGQCPTNNVHNDKITTPVNAPPPALITANIFDPLATNQSPDGPLYLKPPDWQM